MRLCDWLTRQHQTLTQSPSSPVSPQVLTGLACSLPHDPHRHRQLDASRPDLVRTPSISLSLFQSFSDFVSLSLSNLRPCPRPLQSRPHPSFFLSFSLLPFFFFSFSLIFSLSLLTFQFNHILIDSLYFFLLKTDSLYYYNYTVWVLYFSCLVLLSCGVLCWIFYMWIVDCDWCDLLILFCGHCDLVVGKLRIIGVVADSVTVFVNLMFIDFVICGWGLLVGSGLDLVY